MKKSTIRRKNFFRSLVGSALVGASLFQLAIPVFAEGVAAGTGISNTATATYEDPNDPNTTIDATSNTVTITVAEVAGITVEPAGITDTDGGSVETNDELQFDFNVTNTGNEATDFFIPGLNTINQDTGNGNTVTAVEIIDTDGTTVLATVADDGSNTGVLLGNAINPDQSITVRVTTTVNATSAGTPISITLGNTGPNDNSSDTQNQPDLTDGVNVNEVRTVDVNGDTDPEATGPVNGEREASAFQEILFATESQDLALATIEKTASSAPGATTAGNDDLITYDLTLNVASTSPNGQFTPAPLEGTPINLDGTAGVERVLVSDVIPAGTVLNSTPTAPAGGQWTVVYSISDAATTIPVESSDAGALPAATWTTTEPTDLSTVRRVGFIYDATANGALPANGTDITGFTFTVITSGLPAIGGQVLNLAQTFGQTEGDPDNEIVYDESGDQNPNNFNDDNTPPDDTGTNFDPSTDTGVADETNDGLDENNDNTGTGPDGEDHVVTITGTVEADSDINNGPNGNATAVGPNNDNDDFSNVSTPVPAGTTGTFNPDARTINNTVAVPADIANIDNITIEPISPSEADTATGTTGLYGDNADIPDGTEVTIALDPDGVANSGDERTALYTFRNNIFELTSSTTNGTPDTNATPIEVGTLNGGETQDYTVTVDLPDGTDVLTGTSIPIVAFADDGTRQTDNGDPTPLETGTGPAFTEESVNNITINRVYTGYISLVKEARILFADGTVKEGFSQNPTVQAEPGEFIEYRITYQNISEDQAGNGSILLEAQNFTIIEDGAAQNVNTDGDDNNWATTTTHQQNTSALLEGNTTTVDYLNNAGASIGQSDPADGAEVGRYENNVGTVAPQETGTFQFRRQVNNTGPTNSN